MKVIITGKNGYIGNSVRKRLIEAGYDVSMLDVRSDAWKEQSFAGVDVIIHCAALVHVKPSTYTFDEMYKVNVTLTEQLAQKAKEEGVQRFYFISSIAVYGVGSSCFSKNLIGLDTPLCAKSDYGITKAIAEKKLQQLESSEFSVLILRLPFVYGKGCPGNYQLLRKLSLQIRIVPTIKNQISMIYIGNLTEFIHQALKRNIQGVVVPQNSTIHSTEEMVLLIAKYNGVKVMRVGLFDLGIKVFSLLFKPLRTAFGNEVCSYELSAQKDFYYTVADFERSIWLTEKGFN